MQCVSVCVWCVSGVCLDACVVFLCCVWSSMCVSSVFVCVGACICICVCGVCGDCVCFVCAVCVCVVCECVWVVCV